MYLVHPLMSIHSLAEGALADGAQHTLCSQGPALQNLSAFCGGVHLPARRPDVLLRHCGRSEALLVQSAWPAKPFAYTSSKFCGHCFCLCHTHFVKGQVVRTVFGDRDHLRLSVLNNLLI